ncbi:meiosis II protein Mes1 [Schizosaccharomyces octosporus yFS286]|uniref:Meiosis II protein Mes1 n=1 Tax=Schizosaccharomyces octosporus (strain yFS286) TaxID=483514 RepID=S9Q444_SCHOY|nr:meiosis II protein Mes1 [Schizosaccharomyces octosporus yFS286]EPX74867.1 meiosis II protein Mes1 [Schizosaccharomyces octosporus yFS286]
MLNSDNKENEVPFFAKKELDSSSPAAYRVQRPLMRRPLQELSIEMVPPPSSTSGKGTNEPLKKMKKPLTPSHGFHPYKISTKVSPHSSSTHKQPLKPKSSNRLMSMR